MEYLPEVLSVIAITVSFFALYFSHLRKTIELSGRISHVDAKNKEFCLKGIYFLFSNSGNQSLAIDRFVIFDIGSKNRCATWPLDQPLIVEPGDFTEYYLDSVGGHYFPYETPKIVRFYVNSPDAQEFVIDFEYTFPGIENISLKDKFAPVYLNKATEK